MTTLEELLKRIEELKQGNDLALKADLMLQVMDENKQQIAVVPVGNFELVEKANKIHLEVIAKKAELAEQKKKEEEEE